MLSTADTGGLAAGGVKYAALSRRDLPARRRHV